METDLITAPQKSLWAQVYAAAYAHFTAREAVCFNPTFVEKQYGPRQGIHAPDPHEYACEEADRAVAALKQRSFDD